MPGTAHLCRGEYLSGSTSIFWLTDLNGLLLLGVECEEVCNLLLQTLSLALQPRYVLRHVQDLPREFLLELLDVNCAISVCRTRLMKTGLLLWTLIAVASFMASTKRNRSPRISLVNSATSQHSCSCSREEDRLPVAKAFSIRSWSWCWRSMTPMTDSVAALHS